jgi:hypothetical protein
VGGGGGGASALASVTSGTTGSGGSASATAGAGVFSAGASAAGAGAGVTTAGASCSGGEKAISIGAGATGSGGGWGSGARSVAAISAARIRPCATAAPATVRRRPRILAPTRDRFAIGPSLAVRVGNIMAEDIKWTGQRRRIWPSRLPCYLKDAGGRACPASPVTTVHITVPLSRCG